MKTRTYFGTILALVLLTLSTAVLASTLAWCTRANGVATRNLAFEDLSPLFSLLTDRVPQERDALYVVKVPAEVQQTENFHRLERDAFWDAVIKDKELGTLLEQATETASQDLGYRPSSKELKEAFLNEYYKPSAHDDLGLVYVYSKNRGLLARLSALAKTNGLVAEGSQADVDALLAIKGEQEIAWWKTVTKDASAVFAVGFDPPSSLRRLLGSRRPIVRIGDWNKATRGLSSIREMMDVSPSNAVVINLYPTRPEQPTAWGFSADKSLLYAENGKKLSTELQKLGYRVIEDTFSSKEVVLSKITESAKAGKKILLMAETGVDGDQLLMRIPGLTGGITPAEFSELGRGVINNILLVSCNSNLMSSDLGFTQVGTIYTDSALNLIRLTFSSSERDTPASYIEAGNGVLQSWYDAFARSIEGIASTLDEQASTGVIGEPGSRAHGIGYIYRINFKSAAMQTGLQTPDEYKEDDSLTQPDTQPETPMSAIIVFLIGVLGAVCLEIFRWKKLFEARRLRRYLRTPYILISLTIAIMAGFAAIVFVQLAPVGAYQGIVAFVTGVGLEKLVQLSAKLNIWIPGSPMGGVEDVDNMEAEDSVSKMSLINYLRQ